MEFQKVCYGSPTLLETAGFLLVIAILLLVRMNRRGCVLHAAILALGWPGDGEAVLGSLLAGGLTKVIAGAFLLLLTVAVTVFRHARHASRSPSPG